MQQAVATGSRYVIPYLVIRIRRSHLVEDAINQFAAQDDGSFDLKKPLKVSQLFHCLCIHIVMIFPSCAEIGCV